MQAHGVAAADGAQARGPKEDLVDVHILRLTDGEGDGPRKDSGGIANAR